MIESSARFDRRSRIRMVCLGGVLLVGFSVVIIRAVQLHTTKHGSLQWIAQRQYQAVMPVAKRRGKIVDARGRELAVSVPVQSIFADPSAVADPAAALDAIGQMTPLGPERAAILRRMRPDRKFAWVKRRITPEVAEQVHALKIPGIHFVEESRRVYPNGALASQVLGAVSHDAEPLAGLELAFDKYLRTKSESMTYQRDARGRVYFSPVEFNAQDDVGTMRLTIDKIVQYVTEQAADRAFAATQAQGVMAIVIDVPTGKILAMTSRPTFNPNEYFKYPQEAWRNRGVTDTYEPGSTFKVLIAAAALEHGVDPEERFDCEQGSLRVGHAVLHDHGTSYGVLSLRDIIRVSSNIGAYKVARSVGKRQVADVLSAFGIGARLGLDYPGEVGGVLRAHTTWQPVEFATIAFGQGVTVTPLQLAMTFATIANDGVMMTPYLVEQVSGKHGEVLYHAEPTIRRRVLQPKTAQVLRELLRGVVGEGGGTGRAAASALYSTAGKTGTAQKVREGGRGYAVGRYFASFVGFAPYEVPRIAVFVGVDEPKGAYYGGAVAAPVFREIVEATLQYLEVPLSQAPVIVAEQAADPTVSAVLPTHATHSFTRVRQGKFIMPDLRGLSMRHVMQLVRDAQIPLKMAGSGVAVAQHPGPGAIVSTHRAVEVEFAVPQ